MLSIISTSLFCEFNLVKEIKIHINDLYFGVHPWQILILLFVVATHVIFLVLCLRSGFLQLGSMWILLIHNTLVIAFVTYLFYLTYAFMIVEGLIDFFRVVKSEKLMLDHWDDLLFFFLPFISTLIIAEIFLIRRIKVIRENR